MPRYLKKELYRLIEQDETIFDFLQQDSLDGIWYWDLENQDREWMSPRFWELLGYDPRGMELSASESYKLIFSDDLEVALKNYRKHCEDPTFPYDQVVRYYHKEGSVVWLRCRGMAIRNSDGKPIRLLGAHTNLTPLRQTEEKLAQRTRELQEAKRTIATLMANRLDNMLPMCSVCKKMRDKQDDWLSFDRYLKTHCELEVSHTYCPECAAEALAEIEAMDTC